jgi:hypothetical protein
MDMDEAEEVMKPFFPHDVDLAGRALSRRMNERDGLLLPDWICETVAQQYFTYTVMQSMAKQQEYMRDRMSADDPFKLGTVPLPFMEQPSLN